jgi:hypothetical protein
VAVVVLRCVVFVDLDPQAVGIAHDHRASERLCDDALGHEDADGLQPELHQFQPFRGDECQLDPARRSQVGLVDLCNASTAPSPARSSVHHSLALMDVKPSRS